MVTKEQKRATVNELVEKLSKASAVYLVNFNGLTVEGAIRFRRELKKVNVEYRVAKNTLIGRAIEAVGTFSVPDDVLKGATGVVISYDDAVAPAKVIKEQVEKFELPKLKAAVLEGQFYDGSRLKELAALPSKKDMMAAIVGSLGAPVSGIVNSINAVMRDLASLVEEVAKKKAS